MAISLAADTNNVRALGCALNTNGTTVTAVLADPATHILSVDDNNTGSDHGVPCAVRDANFHPVWMATSSTDGITPVEVYADSNGKLLIQST